MGERDRFQPDKPLASAVAAEENRPLVADEPGAAAGEDGRKPGEMRPLIHADIGREPFDVATFRSHASAGIGPLPALAPEGDFGDEVEREALRKYFTRQFVTLTKRHSPEDAILVRVISDYHQYAVRQAKEGCLKAARSTLQALENMARLDDSELLAVHRVSALPAWALVHWYEGDHEEAIRLLQGALDACLELATRFGHDYLTVKRIHLAANTARVLVSLGSFDRALECVISLEAVVGGRRDRWPFAGKDSLDVPLRNPERLILEEQLGRIGSMATNGRRDWAMNGADSIQMTVSAFRADGRLEGWCVTPAGDGNGFWSFYGPVDAPAQQDAGFKIHVSASISSAGEVLARAIPILIRMGVPFKHAATLEHLAFLSNGSGGQSQVGKFLTAYPPDVPTARQLAQLLHEATDGLHGPQIPSEPSLFPGSLVHYRYGSFSQRWLQLPTGQIVPARAEGEGLVVDERDATAIESSGPDDPFSRLPDARHLRDARVLRDRYVRVQKLHQSPKGSTWMGFNRDLGDDGVVVIKEAYAYVMEGADGLDARQRLRREAECLRQLAPTGLTPVVEEYWEEPRSGFLVYRPTPGPTFASVLTALADEGLYPPRDLLRQWMGALSAAVATVHQHGYVIGDIKPQNLIFTGEHFCFIDLELAGPPTEEPAGCMGTHGYCSPQQSDPRLGRSYLDDIYAMGATMLAAATLTDAATLPDGLSVARLEARRHPQNPVFSAIERCLAPEPHQRFPSAAAIVENCRLPSAAGSGDAARRGTMDAADFMRIACEIGDALLRDAHREGDRVWWVSNHPTVRGNASRDLYAGCAGTALFLGALYDSTRAAPYLDAAIGCGQWLWSTEPIVPRQIEMPGLYVGECGPGLLYLRLYKSTGDGEWLDRARAVSQEVSCMARHSPDIMTGAAGTGLFHLILWQVSGDEAALRRARLEAYALLETRTKARPTWVIPPGHETLSGQEYAGFSHGSAGIGYFLAEYCLARREPEFEAACVDIANWIVAQGRSCLHDGSGLTWSTLPNGEGGYTACWCHGSAGIARFLLRAYCVSGDPAYLHAAERAGRTVAVGSTWNGTTQCHGLAGNADVLVDIWRHAAGQHLVAAQALGENLVAYRTERGWPSESHNVFSADLMVGQAGVGAAFMRLADPRLPHLISSEAFAGVKAV